MMMYSETDDQYRARYQVTDVTRPLDSVSRVCDQGNHVLFTQTGGWIMNHETGRYAWFPREHGVYVLHSWINEFPTGKRGQMSLFPGTVRLCLKTHESQTEVYLGRKKTMTPTLAEREEHERTGTKVGRMISITDEPGSTRVRHWRQTPEDPLSASGRYVGKLERAM